MVTKMKPSGIEWIGEIPCAWGCEKLKYHATINPTTDLKAIEFDDDTEVSFVPMEHLHNGFHDYSSIAFSQVKRGYTVFSEGDILLAKVTPCFENGNIAIAEDLIKGVGFGSTEILTIRCNSINPSFTYYCLQNPTFKARAVAEMYGVAGLKRIPPTFIANSFFPFPSSSTQQHIAEYLDQKCSDIDKIILAKQRQNELLKEQRQSIIYEAVTKGLDKQVKYKDSGIEWIGEIPEDWDISKVKYFYETQLGKMLQPSQKNDNETVEKYLCSFNITWDGINQSEIKEMWFNEREKKIFGIKRGDLLVLEGGDAGRACICDIDFPYYIQNAVHRVRARENAINKYLYYWLYVLKAIGYIDLLCNKATIMHFTQDKMLNIDIPIPPIDVQQHIADYLDQKCADIDRIINTNNDMLEKLKEYRQSIVYEAVTGKI